MHAPGSPESTPLVNAATSRPAWLRVLLDPVIASVLLGVLGFVILHPLDARVAHAANHLEHTLAGDIRREWFAWQQFGQGLALAVCAAIIWTLDPPRRRRLLDLGLAAGLTQLACQAGKVLVGRPRPRSYFDDPHTFLGPMGQYPVPAGAPGEWKLASAMDAGADLWSMPSSHTAMAVVLATFLAALYPRLTWLMLALAALVGAGRVVFDAHWPTDVVIGAALGLLIGRVVVSKYLGVRVLDSLWRTLVNRSATPSYPAIAHAEANRRARAQAYTE